MVLTAFVLIGGRGTGIAIAAASGSSSSSGAAWYYAYYHCRPGCRAVNVTKAQLEGLFADELALLQPTPGYMRLLKESAADLEGAEGRCS